MNATRKRTLPSATAVRFAADSAVLTTPPMKAHPSLLALARLLARQAAREAARNVSGLNGGFSL